MRGRALRDLALREEFWGYQLNDPYGVDATEYSVMLTELPAGVVTAALDAVRELDPEMHYWIGPASRCAYASGRGGSLRAPLT